LALSKPSLKSDLQSLFQSPPAAVSDIADAWAAAYGSYAAGARSCQAGSPILSGRQGLLSSALAAVFTSSTNPATTAASFDAAFVAFWAGVVFSGTTPGVAVAVPGVLSASLPVMWASNVASSASYSDAAQAHADTFDIFTKTVIVTHAPPSACSGPIA
jgi:hypothetical protein